MAKTYKSNPNLPFIKKDYPGNLVVDGAFTNTDHKEKALWKEVLKWLISPNPQKKEKKEDTFRVKVEKGTRFLEGKKDAIVWLGHASFFIQLKGKRILTDPVFFNIPTVPRLAGMPCSAENFKNIDFILLSHCHRDHLDKKTLNILIENNPDVTFLVALNSGKILNKIKPGLKIQEAGWYQKFDTGCEVEIDFLPAHHWNRRGLFDFNEELWGSFMIHGSEEPVYFAGDTSYGDHFKEIGNFYKNIGAALMPIGAYKPAFLMNKYHINPEQAFQAFKELQAKVFIPMHYGTYDLSNEPIGEPVRMINRIFKENKAFEALKVASIGEEVLL